MPYSTQAYRMLKLNLTVPFNVSQPTFMFTGEPVKTIFLDQSFLKKTVVSLLCKAVVMLSIKHKLFEIY